jgi:hypothetical protein
MRVCRLTGLYALWAKEIKKLMIYTITLKGDRYKSSTSDNSYIVR